MDGLRDIFARLSSLAGTDLTVHLDAARKRAKAGTETGPDEIAQAAIEKARESLPTTRAKKRFDRELQNERRQKSKQKEAQRNRKNDIRRLHQLQVRLDRTHPPGTAPKGCPTHLWKMVKHILSDPTGHAAYAYMKVSPHKVGVGLAKRAALAIDENGDCRYSFAGTDRGANRARCVMAFWLLLLGISKPAGRGNRKWGRIVKGFPMGFFIAALADPTKKGSTPGRSTLSGTHRKDPEHTAFDGRVGYLRALKNVGAIYTRQARWQPGQEPTTRGWEDLSPNEVSPNTTDTGWRVSLNRYWLVTDQFQDPENAAHRAELWTAWVTGLQPRSFDESSSLEPVQRSGSEPPSTPPAPS